MKDKSVIYFTILVFPEINMGWPIRDLRVKYSSVFRAGGIS